MNLIFSLPHNDHWVRLKLSSTAKKKRTLPLEVAAMGQVDNKQEGTSKRLSPNFLRRFKSKQRNSAEKRTSPSLAPADTSAAKRQSPESPECNTFAQIWEIC